MSFDEVIITSLFTVQLNIVARVILKSMQQSAAHSVADMM
jgi:hypothetical protein